MAWINPNAPSLADFLSFVVNEMQVPANAMPPATVTTPSAPALTAGSGGSLPTETIYVTITYLSLYGETIASSETSIGVTGPNGSVSIASPPAVLNATGWNVYATTASGAEVLQTSTPAVIGTPYVLSALSTTSTTAAPTVNTTGWTWVTWALKRALNLVFNLPTVAGSDYTLAVYNCAGHILLGITPDQAGVIYQDNMGFFAYNRSAFDMNEFSPGVISSSTDQGTSNSFATPQNFTNLTAGDLWYLKTPYGVAYISYAQDFGAIAGLT